MKKSPVELIQNIKNQMLSTLSFHVNTISEQIQAMEENIIQEC